MTGRVNRERGERTSLVFGLYNRIVNPVVRPVLRSPLHRLLSGGLMLLTYRGSRTGRSYTIPVQYAREGNTVIAYPGRAAGKTWWRNLAGGADVTLRIKGRDLRGHAVAVTNDRETIADGLRIWLRRFPSSARRLGVARDPDGRPDPQDLARAAERIVIVRMELREPPADA